MTDRAQPGDDAVEASATDVGASTGDVAGLSFDAALAEFQRVVAALEEGGQPLEQAITLYERGVALNGRLERLLDDAELRIRRLVERAGGRIEARDDAVDQPDDTR